MIIGISMGLETCQILGQVSHNLLYWKKNSRRIYVVRGEIDEKTAYIQAISSMARALEINGKAEEPVSQLKVKDFAARSKAKAKPQRREPVDYSPSIIPMKESGLILNQEILLSLRTRFRRK